MKLLKYINVLLLDQSGRLATNHVNIKACIDTGSEVNLIRKECLNYLTTKTINESKIKIQGVNGCSNTEGQVPLQMVFTSHMQKGFFDPPKANMMFQVSDEIPAEIIVGQPLLRRAIIDMIKGMMTVKMRKSRKLPGATLKLPLMDYPDQDYVAYFATSPREEQQLFEEKVKKFEELTKKMDEEPKENDNLKKIKISDDLNQTQVESIKALLEEYRDIFRTDNTEISLFKFGEHVPLRLPLTSATYSQPRHRPFPKKLYSDFDKQIQQWKKLGVIKEQDRHVKYRNNIVPVRKSDGTWRYCLDCSILNTIVSQENQVLPKIPDLLQKMAGSKVYTKLDISQFFLNFAMDRDSSDLTTFYNPTDGMLYRFCRTPFGLRWSLTNSIKMANKELNKIPGVHDFLVAYVDDLVVYSPSVEDHRRHLQAVFEVLQKCNFRVKHSKIKVAYKSIDIFGYEVSEKGYTMSKERKDSLLRLSRPKSKADLQSVIGQLSYFRRVLSLDIPMAKINAAFADLLRGGKSFRWKPEHDDAWEMVKKSLHDTVLLNSLLETDEELILRTDSSEGYFGATLTAVRDGEEYLISTLSRMWSPQANKYHITRKELIGALICVKEFKCELIGRKVRIVNDNAMACAVLSEPDKIDCENLMMQRLFGNMWGIQYTVEKTTNKDMHFKLVDLLSRSDNKKAIIRSRNVLELITMPEETEPEKLYHSYPLTRTQDRLMNERPLLTNTEVDQEIVGMTNIRALKEFRELVSATNREINDRGEIPNALRHQLIRSLHEICHFGKVKMAAILNSNEFKWKNREKDIMRHIHECKTCGVYKQVPNRLNIGPTYVPADQPKTYISFDEKIIKGSQPLNVMIGIDLITSYTQAVRIQKNLNSESVVHAILILLVQMAPQCRCIKVDNDPRHKSDYFKNVFKQLGIEVIYSSRSNSRGNAHVERIIGEYSKQFAMLNLVDKPLSHWDLAIPLTSLFINMIPRPLHGISPYELHFGEQLVMNVKKVRQTGDASLNIYAENLNKKILAMRTLAVMTPKANIIRNVNGLRRKGDLVRIKMPKKPNVAQTLSEKYSVDIFEVKEVDTMRFTYKIQNLRKPAQIMHIADRHVKSVKIPIEKEEPEQFRRTDETKDNYMKMKQLIDGRNETINKRLEDKDKQQKRREITRNKQKPQRSHPMVTRQGARQPHQ